MNNKEFIKKLKKEHLKNDKKRLQLSNIYAIENIQHKEQKQRNQEKLDLEDIEETLSKDFLI